jgi:hypothetical protein
MEGSEIKMEIGSKHTEKAKERIKRGLKNKWKDPHYQDKISKIRRLFRHTKSSKKKMGEIRKKEWANPNSAFNSKGYKKKRRRMMKDKWKDINSKFYSTEYREKQSSNGKKRWKKVKHLLITTNTKQLPQSAHKMSPELAYVLGVMLGDGTMSNYSLRLIVKDKDFALKFKQKLEKWNGYSIELKRVSEKRYKKHYWKVIFHSKKACKILKKYKENIRKIMLNAPRKCQIAFLEGLYDSEGYVSLIKHGKRIFFCNTKKRLVKLVCHLLSYFKIETSINKHKTAHQDIYYSITSKRENVLQFYKYIHFSIARKQDRLNQIISSYSRKKPYALGQKIINTDATLL